MKNKLPIIFLILAGAVNIVLFQNCTPKSDGQLVDSSNLQQNDIPEVTVVAGASKCGGASDPLIGFGQPISICIQYAGNNPQYCIQNNGNPNLQCSPLVGGPGWVYRSQDDVWYKTFQYSDNPQLYFFPESYSIEVRDTRDSSLRGFTQFVVQQ